jgi:MFS family permease
MVMGLAAVGGQVIAGLLIAPDIGGTGWRMIFLINVPIGLIGLALVSRMIPDPKPGQKRQAVVVAAVNVAGSALPRTPRWTEPADCRVRSRRRRFGTRSQSRTCGGLN